MNDDKLTVAQFLTGMILPLAFLITILTALSCSGQNIIANGDQWQDVDNNGVGDKWNVDPFAAGTVDTAQHISDGAIWQGFSKQQPGVYRFSVTCGSLQPVIVTVGTLAGDDHQYIIMPTSWAENVVFLEPTKVFNSIKFSSIDWFVIDHVELIKVAGVQPVEVEVMGERFVKEVCR